MKTKYCWTLFVFFVALIAPLLSCRSTTPAQNILVDQGVVVPAGGNTAEVVFSAGQGQRIRISLQAKDKALQPYGYLTFPDGDGKYLPLLDHSQEGSNTGEIVLPQAGDYTLAVMDGSNLGGQVTLKIEILK